MCVCMCVCVCRHGRPWMCTVCQVTYYDSVTGKPLFIAPKVRSKLIATPPSLATTRWSPGHLLLHSLLAVRGPRLSCALGMMRVAMASRTPPPQGRSFKEFLQESRAHGWPSFRDEEVGGGWLAGSRHCVLSLARVGCA